MATLEEILKLDSLSQASNTKKSDAAAPRVGTIIKILHGFSHHCLPNKQSNAKAIHLFLTHPATRVKIYWGVAQPSRRLSAAPVRLPVSRFTEIE